MQAHSGGGGAAGGRGAVAQDTARGGCCVQHVLYGLQVLLGNLSGGMEELCYSYPQGEVLSSHLLPVAIKFAVLAQAARIKLQR